MYKLAATLCMLSVIVMLGGCDAVDSAAYAAPRTQPPLPRVKLVAVTHGPIARTLRVAGTVRHKSESELAFKVGGVVRRVRVEEGDRVRRGQVLAAVDPTEARALRNQANAAVVKAERDLARARQLMITGALAQVDLQNSETALALARGDAETAAFNLEHTSVVAPESGIVDWRHVEVGEIVAPGQPVFRVHGSSRGAVVRVELSDRDAMALELGQAARVLLDARPREELRARVSRIATSASIGTGMLSVEVRLEKPPRRLPSGVTAKVELETVLAADASVPVSALADGDAVFVVAGERLRRVPVRVEFLSGDRAALSGELEALQDVVELGAAVLADGDRVQVVD